MYSLWPSEEVQTIFAIGIICIQLFIPFLILVICYGKIVWVLTRRINTNLIKTTSQYTKDNAESAMNTNTSVINNSVTPASDTGKVKFQLARRNTIKTVLIVGLCFIICWSQNQITYFMYNCGYDINYNSTYIQFTVLMVFLNCTVNPFIYLIKYKDYQEALKKCFHCTMEKEDDNNLNSSISGKC